MKLEYVPLLEVQRELYRMPRGFERFREYLRTMIDAKLQGQGVDLAEPVESDRGNVIDLMAALKKSLSEPTEVAPAEPKSVKETSKGKPAGQTAAKTPRKRA